jgi:GTP-binding protein YchF
MTINIGVVGLAQSGKTTVFNALTRGQADTRSSTLHIGKAKVPEPRLAALAEMLQPRRVVPAEVSYTDIGASVKRGEGGMGDHLLGELSNTDAIINVVRAFADDSIPHPEGSLDVERDIAAIDLELALHDAGIINRRLERIETSLKGADPTERQMLLREQQLLTKLKAELEKEVPIRQLELSAEENKTIANFQFLTAKPLLILVNIGEEQVCEAASLEKELDQRHCGAGLGVITLCGKLEMEFAQLDEEAEKECRAEFGVTEPGLDRVIRLSYQLLDLVTFFTTASEEVKAWSIPRGTTALKAAGKIHSDMERGFIRAEAISYDDLMKCGGMAEAHRRGRLRLEGKNYVVQDGDVITFLFNV